MSARKFLILWDDANGKRFHYPEGCTRKVMLRRVSKLMNKCPVKKTHAIKITITEAEQ